MSFKPMLAAEYNPELAIFPMYISRKLDGIRFIMKGGKALSRSLKEIPNGFVQEIVCNWPDGIDGEIIVGSPTDPNCMQHTTSGVMSYDGKPDVSFHLFDLWNEPKEGFAYRKMKLYYMIQDLLKIEKSRVFMVQQELVMCHEDVEERTAAYLEEGYEGAILRQVTSLYKHGRSTQREGRLLKVKHFADAEATIVGFEERFHNSNAPTINALGYMERSSHQENMVPTGTLGAFTVQCPGFKQSFNVGTGFNEHQRTTYWSQRTELIGRTIKFKYQPHGVKDVPRTPVFLGFRDERDMS